MLLAANFLVLLVCQERCFFSLTSTSRFLFASIFVHTRHGCDVLAVYVLLTLRANGNARPLSILRLPELRPSPFAMKRVARRRYIRARQLLARVLYVECPGSNLRAVVSVVSPSYWVRIPFASVIVHSSMSINSLSHYLSCKSRYCTS
ncbi:hypothetical protein FA95DRAFT_811310 [Auriscalpium vulgare]|uniref:Uncharacterized protein n=1 Tax=Auriscalpium vulgare TaxID=40419 RepID=A0ACB8RAE3_9AGAM|nr:hypothetical protein FA95DRAFT_811310 [Auriscalpium vulgare]